jgi:hypothetical protein
MVQELWNYFFFKIQKHKKQNILKKLGGAFGRVGKTLMSGISWS